MDLMILIVPAAVVVLSAAAALALTLRSRGLARACWAVCALAISVGGLSVVSLLLYPPEEFDEAGNLIGEMPKAFGAALAFTVAGMAALPAGLAVRSIHRALQRGGKRGFPPEKPR